LILEAGFRIRIGFEFNQVSNPDPDPYRNPDPDLEGQK
jgi:hypothetical protein